MEVNNYRDFFYLYPLNMQKHTEIGTMFSVKTISKFFDFKDKLLLDVKYNS